MNPDTSKSKRAARSQPQETELKLALPGADPAGLARRLARLPVLARRKATRVQLHNVYFDTPEQALRQQNAALRIRRVGPVHAPHWLQTLKTGDVGGSALSRRGEWETPVSGAALEPQALDPKAWSRIDPQGRLLATLAPVFVTDFERTLWLVRRRDGSAVEVALDIGLVAGGDKTARICELELELKAGPVGALFDVALQVAAGIAVLPLGMSKAQRGYALAQDAIDAPCIAAAPALTADLSPGEAAYRVLGEMFGQFSANLNALRGSDDPEVVHQARVAWRRLRSAMRLFRPLLATQPAPDWSPLRPLLALLGELRDLDVARTETLPGLQQAFVDGDARRDGAWDAMAQSLLQAAGVRRHAVRHAIEDPALGGCLVKATQWIEQLANADAAPAAEPAVALSLQRWARRRVTRLRARLRQARKDAVTSEQQHRVRILAKRARYGIEAVRSLLPRRKAQRWHAQATQVQKSIGATRDLEQAGVLLRRMEADPGMVEFLRGVAIGRKFR